MRDIFVVRIFIHVHISNRQYVCALIVSEIYDFRECARSRFQTMRSLVKYSTNSNALHLRVMDLTVLSRTIRTLSRRHALSCPHDVTLVSQLIVNECLLSWKWTNK